MAQGFLLSEGDQQTLRRMLGEFNARLRNTAGRGPVEAIDYPNRDVYIARTPSGGIPALAEAAGTSTRDEPGHADCEIYRILRVDEATGTGNSIYELHPVPTHSRRVFNLSGTAVGGNAWCMVAMEKFGQWVHVPLSSSGSSGLGDHGARVYHGSNQTVSHNTPLVLAWNTELWDTDAYHDNVTSNTDFIVPSGQAGKYLVGVQVRWAGSTTQETAFLNLLVNGAPFGVAANPRPSGGSSYEIVQVCSWPVNLAVGDAVELRANQLSTGSASQTVVAGLSNTFFWLQRLA